MQIIVIDDGSTDGTAAWLSGQSGVTTIEGEGWGKPSGVNRALAIADGKYLRFLDSDDWLSPDANELQFRLLIGSWPTWLSPVTMVFGRSVFRVCAMDTSDDFVAQPCG